MELKTCIVNRKQIYCSFFAHPKTKNTQQAIANLFSKYIEMRFEKTDADDYRLFHD